MDTDSGGGLCWGVGVAREESMGEKENICNTLTIKINLKIIKKRTYMYSAVIFIENNLHVSGPVQLKPVLFKGPLYFNFSTIISFTTSCQFPLLLTPIFTPRAITIISQFAVYGVES